MLGRVLHEWPHLLLAMRDLGRKSYVGICDSEAALTFWTVLSQARERLVRLFVQARESAPPGTELSPNEALRVLHADDRCLEFSTENAEAIVIAPDSIIGEPGESRKEWKRRFETSAMRLARENDWHCPWCGAEALFRFQWPIVICMWAFYLVAAVDTPFCRWQVWGECLTRQQSSPCRSLRSTRCALWSVTS